MISLTSVIGVQIPKSKSKSRLTCVWVPKKTRILDEIFFWMLWSENPMDLC